MTIKTKSGEHVIINLDITDNREVFGKVVYSSNTYVSTVQEIDREIDEWLRVARKYFRSLVA